MMGTSVSALLFADDAALLASTPQGLQLNIDRFVKGLAVYGVYLNAAKCAAVHVFVDRHPKKWYVARDVPLQAEGQNIKALTIGELYRYLGLSLIRA